MKTIYLIKCRRQVIGASGLRTAGVEYRVFSTEEKAESWLRNSHFTLGTPRWLPRGMSGIYWYHIDSTPENHVLAEIRKRYLDDPDGSKFKELAFFP